jgi:hypothetical protein
MPLVMDRTNAGLAYRHLSAAKHRMQRRSSAQSAQPSAPAPERTQPEFTTPPLAVESAATASPTAAPQWTERLRKFGRSFLDRVRRAE